MKDQETTAIEDELKALQISLDPEPEDVAAEDEEFSTPWSRRLHSMVAKMTTEELAEFPDLKRVDEVHTLVFNATRELVQTPDLSLADAISACGRRLRGLHLGLATSHDVVSPFPTAFHEALKKARGGDESEKGKFDPKEPLEVHLGDILMKEYEGMRLMSLGLSEAVEFTHQLVRAMEKWLDKPYRKKLLARLEEIGVVDFNPGHLLLRLMSLIADFYLNHPGGLPSVHQGIKLLEDIAAINKEDFGAAYCLADIRITQRNPKAGYDISHKALEVAIASGFQYNAARLGLCCAEAIMAGARGAGYTSAQVTPFLEASRSRLDSCKFWLPESKYETYSKILEVYEKKFNITPGSSNPNPTQISLHIAEMPTSAPHFISQMLRNCAGCKENSIESPVCSGCREVYYCSVKCQRAHWPSHKEACKKKQAELKASAAAK